MLGTRLHPQVNFYQIYYADKITGMILEMDKDENFELIHDELEFYNKINEAIRVLEEDTCLGNFDAAEHDSQPYYPTNYDSNQQ